MCDQYIAIPPLLIFYSDKRDFEIYMKSKDTFILYAKEGKLEERHKQILYENEVKVLYIKTNDKVSYQEYIESNFGNILLDASIPIIERSKVLYTHSNELLHQAFENRLPNGLNNEFFEKLQNIINLSYDFLENNQEAFKSFGKLISHDYKTYNHCLNVFIYTFYVLKNLKYNEEDIKNICFGAMIHDIGKISIPEYILNKPGRLTDDEFDVIKQHPAKGVVLCKYMRLNQMSTNCVLFHHEKLDGSGYPGGIDQKDLPEYVKVITICDIYDALVSDRPYAKAYTPFEALKIILNDVQKGKLDVNLVKLFISLLSEAKLCV